jgi:hypothetical protein
VANLFTSQTPSITNASDGTPGITVGTTEVYDDDGTVSGIWFYGTDTISGSYSVALWRVDSSDPGSGTQLAGKVLGAPPTPGWNYVAFTDGEGNPAPVNVTAGVPYRPVQFSGDGRYVATLGFPWPISNAGATGVADGATVGALTVNQGTFRINASTDYPNSDGNSSCYFVAGDYTAAVTTTGEGALVLPALTSSGEGTASAAGSASLTLPALTATGEGTASATGNGAPTLPALTASGTGTASATGSGTLTLPAVTASGTGGEPVDEPSAPTSTLATTSQPATLGTTSRPGYLATGTPPT